MNSPDIHFSCIQQGQQRYKQATTLLAVEDRCRIFDWVITALPLCIYAVAMYICCRYVYMLPTNSFCHTNTISKQLFMRLAVLFNIKFIRMSTE